MMAAPLGNEEGDRMLLPFGHPGAPWAVPVGRTTARTCPWQLRPARLPDVPAALARALGDAYLDGARGAHGRTCHRPVAVRA
jgi:hypothetical protein